MRTDDSFTQNMGNKAHRGAGHGRQIIPWSRMLTRGWAVGAGTAITILAALTLLLALPVHSQNSRLLGPSVVGSGPDWDTANPTQPLAPTPEPFRPGTIYRLAASSPEPGQIHLTWDPPRANVADDYRVSWTKSDSDWAPWQDLNSNAYPATNRYTIKWLEYGAQYKVRVRARVSRDTPDAWSGPWSQTTFTVSSPPAGSPNVPTGLVATLDYGVPVVTWTGPDDDSITGYRIQRGPDDYDLTTLEADTGNDAPAYLDTSAQVGHTYHYAVQGINASGIGGLSAGVSIKIHSGPHRLSALVSDSGVSLSWTAPDGTAVIDYRIFRGTSADATNTIVADVSSTGTHYTDTAEHSPGRIYYTVAAQTADGITRRSAPGAVDIPDDAEVAAVGINSESVVLISNAGSPVVAEAATVDESPVMQRFHTGPAEPGYTLHSVQLSVTPRTGTPTVSVSVHADDDGSPATELYHLASPVNLDAKSDVFTAPEGAWLLPNTAYWLAIRRTSKGGVAAVSLVSGLHTDSRTMHGFSFSSGSPATQHGTGGSQAPRSHLSTDTSVHITVNGHDIADVPASIASTEVVAVGQVRHGDINFYADHDWYRVTLTANQEYSLEVDPGTAHRAQIFGVYGSDGVKQTVHAVEAHSAHAAEHRVYFTPSTTGAHYLAAGVAAHAASVESHRTQETVEGEVVEVIHYTTTTTGTYTVQVSLADPESAGIGTVASASPGDTHYGEFFPPHNNLTDTDWIKVPMREGKKYLLLLGGDTPTVDFRIVNVRDSSGTAVAGFVATGSDKNRAGNWNQSSVDAIFEPTASGDYFIELTARAANYMKTTYTDSTEDGETTTTGTQALADHSFHGAQYRFRVWSPEQPSENEPAGHDSIGTDAFTEGHARTDGGSVAGVINSASDADWYSVWLDQGEDYVIMLEGSTTLRFDGVREWPEHSVHRFANAKGGGLSPGSSSQCAFTTYRAEKDGVHFITVSGTQPQTYKLWVSGVANLGNVTETNGTDAGTCAAPGVLKLGATADGAIARAAGVPDPDAYLVWMEKGPSYSLEVTAFDSGDGTLPDPEIELLGQRSSTAIPTTADAGNGHEESWQGTVTETGPYLFVISSATTGAGTYKVSFRRIGVTYESDGQDLMPDGDRSAGYLAVHINLDGTFSDDDYYDGFTIDAVPGKRYRLTVSERGGVGGYEGMHATVWRFDGSRYKILDKSHSSTFPPMVQNRFHSGGIQLNFMAETPPAGTTYTYHGMVRPVGTATRLFTGGYRVSLIEDDYREIVDHETYHYNTAGNIALSLDEVMASIEADDDADTFVFRLRRGTDYVIGVRAAPSAEGRTLPHAAVEHLRWSKDDFVQRRTGAIEESVMAAAKQISPGEFLLHLTAPETAHYMLTVHGRPGETGTYSVIVTEPSTGETGGRDLPANIWTTARLEQGQISNGRLQTGTDSDWYVFRMDAGQLYVFSSTALQNTNTAPTDGRIAILGASGEILTGQTTHTLTSSTRDFYYRPTRSGTYYIQKDSTRADSSGSGNYGIVWEVDDHGHQDALPTATTLGQRITGTLSARDKRGFINRDSDYFSVQLEQGKTYRAEAWGIGADGVDVGGNLPNPDIYAPLIQPHSATKKRADEGAGQNDIFEITPPSTGTFVVGVTSWSDIYRDHTYTFFIEEAHTQVDLKFGAAMYDASSGSVTVTVSLDQAPGREVTIPITVTESGDTTSSHYSGVPETVTFLTTETSKTFNVASSAPADTSRSVTLGFGEYLPREVTAVAPVTTNVLLSGNTAPTTTDSRADAVENMDYVFRYTDFPYTDTGGDATLHSIKITSLPDGKFGSLIFDGTRVGSTNPPRVVTKAELDAGSLVFRPTTGQFQDNYASFRFRVNDGMVDSDERTLTVDVVADDHISLVSNTYHPRDGGLYDVGNAGGSSASQGFHTGDYAHGYELRSVGINLEQILFTGSENLSLFIYSANTDGTPNEKIYRLTHPWSHGRKLPIRRIIYFSAPDHTVLEPGTNYLVVFQGSGRFGWDAGLAINSQDGERGEAGWTLENALRSNGVLHRQGDSIKLTVRGKQAQQHTTRATVEAGDNVDTEGGDAEFTITLTEPAPTGGLTVEYTVTEIERRDRSPDGAHHGQLPYDFVDTVHEGDKSVTFAAGESSKTITIPTVVDSLHEDHSGGQTNYLQLVIDEGTGYIPAHSSAAQLDISEGGQRPVVFFRDAMSGITVREDVGHATVVIQLSEPFTHLFNIHVVNAEGSASRRNDFVDSTAGGLVDFPAGRAEASFNADIVNSRQLENSEYFNLSIWISGSARTESSTSHLEVTIEDDDTEEITISTEKARVNEGDTITIDVLPDHPRSLNDCHIPFPVHAMVTASGDTSALVDSAAQTGRAQPCGRATFTFGTVESTTVTADRSVTFTLVDIGTNSTLTTNDERLSIADDDTVTVTIVEDDAAHTASVRAGDDVDEEGDDAEFTLTLGVPAPAAGITVDYNVTEIERRSRAAGGVDEGELPYDFVASEHEGDKSVTFAAGESSKTITIPTVADSLHEEGGGDTNYLRVTVVAGTGYTVGTATAELDLNEGGSRPKISFRDAATGISVAEEAGNADVVAILTEPFAYDAHFYFWLNDITARPPSDYIREDNTLRQFAPGASEVSILVPIVDNIQVEETETFDMGFVTASIIPTVSATNNEIVITITDSDTATVHLRAGAASVKEGESITIRARVDRDRGLYDCDIPFSLYYQLSVSGDTSGLVNSATSTQRGAACDQATFTYATADDVSASADRTVTFTLADIGTNEALTSDHDRILTATANTMTITIVEDEATGGPVINGPTPLQVGDTLSVDLTGIDDADGRSNLASNVTYNWRRYGADGTTLDTDAVSTKATYVLTSDDLGHTIGVQVNFTDDEGNREGPLTSDATSEVASAARNSQEDTNDNREDTGDGEGTDEDESLPEDIVATITGLPASHDGSTKFTFELHFSPTPRISYVAVRDLLFDIVNATIHKANRLNPPSSAGWLVHVTPTSDGDIILALPPTSDCEAADAVCTDEGGKQTNGILLLVAGP